MERRGAPPTEDDIVKEIWRRREDEGETIDEIYLAFQHDASFARKDGTLRRGCSKRNIQRILSKGRAADPTGRWSPFDADGDPDVAALVLPTLAGIMERSQGKKVAFSEKQIDRLAQVIRAVPGLRPRFAWSIAMYSMMAEAEGRQVDSDSLFALVAFAPWRGPAEMERFQRWVERCRPDWNVEPPIGVSLALEMSSALERPEDDDFPHLHRPPHIDGVAGPGEGGE